MINLITRTLELELEDELANGRLKGRFRKFIVNSLGPTLLDHES
jgi:hypothetical protein